MLDGLVAQWIRHLTTNQGIPGSSPGKIVLESAFQKRKKEPAPIVRDREISPGKQSIGNG